jgi:hypothetical protein
MDDLDQNATSHMIQSVSIERHQERSSPMLYASVNTAQSSKTATDWRFTKGSDFVNKIAHHWHRWIKQKHTIFHVKFEGRFSILFTRELVFNKKWYFSQGMVRPFFRGRSTNISGTQFTTNNMQCTEPHPKGKDVGIKERTSVYLAVGEIQD